MNEEYDAGCFQRVCLVMITSFWWAIELDCRETGADKMQKVAVGLIISTILFRYDSDITFSYRRTSDRK